MWFGEPHPFPERGSPTELSTSGQQSYEGWSYRISSAIGPWTFPTRVLHVLRSTSSSFKFQYPLVSLTAYGSCLRLLLRPLFTFFSFLPVFPPITCFRKQILRQMWPIQLAFPLLLHVKRSFVTGLRLMPLSFPHDWSNWSTYLQIKKIGRPHKVSNESWKLANTPCVIRKVGHTDDGIFTTLTKTLTLCHSWS